MVEEHEMSPESLQKSIKTAGELYPILENQEGKILDGNHRAQSNPKHHRKTIQTKNRAEEILVRLHAHHRRQVPQEETKALLVELAQELEKGGMPKENVTTELCKIVPFSERYVMELMPQEYKQPEKVEAGQRGGQTSAALAHQTVTIQDIVSCDRCHVSTSTPVEWNNHQLCEQCHKKALANPDTFNSYFNYLGKKPEPKPVLTTNTARPLEKWEERKAHMSPQHSKMEGIVIASLIESGVTGIIQDRHFCVQETIPDIYLPAQNLAIYLDGEVHNGKQDRDEQLRELLTKRHGVQVLSYSYDSTSQKEVDRVTKEILAVVKVEASQ